MKPTISFYNHHIRFTLKNKIKIRKWIMGCATAEQREIGEISYLFSNDDYVLEANQQYLHHDYLTDILTFDYCEGNILQGDIIISIDRIKDNAKRFGVSMENELLRVIIHGILHLCGYKDKTKKEAAIMHSKEDEYLQQYYNNNL
jgi:rRNA maturation RNase YbeY